MSYKPVTKTYTLEFVDKPGLLVTAAGATVAEITYASRLSLNVNEEDDEKRMEIFEFFAGKLISWNIIHPELPVYSPPEPYHRECINCGLPEDAPMPPTPTSMMCLELDLVSVIIMGWIFAVARVSVPKGLNSSNGGNNGLTEAVMQELEKLQNPVPLPVPNFT